MDELVSDNQRKDLRILFNNDVRFSTDQFNWHLGRADNISNGGIFVETERMLRVGTKIYLNFGIPTNFQNIKAAGEVVRWANVAGGSIKEEFSGMGIRFSLSPSEDLMIGSFIRGILDNSVPVHSPSLRQPSRRSLSAETIRSLIYAIKWWVREVVTKYARVNYLIAELAVLVFIVMMIKTLFKK
jgi:Tfp pilus assembly protein PilZ